jgi:hypothetical protein
MLNNPTRGFRLRFLGVCVFLLAVVFILLPERYQQNLGRLFSSGKISGNERLLDTKTDRSADSLRRKNVRSPRRDPKEWFAEVRARNPELEPEWRTVPDHENGFLQWLEFCEKHRIEEGLGTEKLDIPENIAEMLSDPEKWDSQAMKAFLDENKELLDTITRIGLLPSQSAAGIDVDRWSFIGARFTKQSADLLLADARMAAEAGDLNLALTRVKAVSGLANHYDQIEAPTLLMATISILVRLNAQDQVIKHFLPALNGNTAEIARWREVVRSPNMEPADYARLLRGEGWLGLSAFVIPMVNTDNSYSSRSYIPDPDALFDAYAQSCIATAKKAQTLTLDELFIIEENDDPGSPIDVTHLSKEAQSLLELCRSGTSAWANGWARSVSLSARTDAALAILQGEEIPLEPFTGIPYVYDPVMRTVQAPLEPSLLEKLKMGDPLKLP